MWKPVITYNKPTISPTHHRKDIKILDRVVLRVVLKTRKRPTYNFCSFSVYTGGSVIESNEDGSILKIELDEYNTRSDAMGCAPVLLTFEPTTNGQYSCQQIKQSHWLETLDHKPLLFLSPFEHPNEFTPDWDSPPGDTILDLLSECNWSQFALSKCLKCTPEYLSQLIRGEVPIDEEMAIKLEKILGGTAKFWLNREAQYRYQLTKTKNE